MSDTLMQPGRLETVAIETLLYNRAMLPVAKRAVGVARLLHDVFGTEKTRRDMLFAMSTLYKLEARIDVLSGVKP